MSGFAMGKTRRRRPATAWVVAAIAGACGGTTVTDGGNTDGHTSWLAACETDADCESGLSCQCGACTLACQDSAECRELPRPAVCLEVSSSAEDGVCRLGVATEGGVCLPTCQRDDDCDVGAGYACLAGVCVGPGFSTAPDGGAPGLMDPSAPADSGSKSGEAGSSSSAPDAALDGGTSVGVANRDATAPPSPSCELEDYTPASCTDHSECNAGEVCLRGACIYDCGEGLQWLAEVDTSLGPDVEPLGMVCDVPQWHWNSHPTEVDGCRRWVVDSFRLDSTEHGTWHLSRFIVDPTGGSGADEILSGRLSEDIVYPGLSVNVELDPDGKALGFGYIDNDTETLTLYRLSLEDGTTRQGPSTHSYTFGGPVWVDADHMMFIHDTNPERLFIDNEVATGSFVDGTLQPLFSSEPDGGFVNFVNFTTLYSRGVVLFNDGAGSATFDLPLSRIETAIETGTPIDLDTDPAVRTHELVFGMTRITDDLLLTRVSNFGEYHYVRLDADNAPASRKVLTLGEGVYGRLVGPLVVGLGGDLALVSLSGHDEDFMTNAMVVRLR